MNEWRETLREPDTKFPGESSEYRRARNQLLGAEDELRRLSEQVAAQRRALPAGGLLAEDYVFESAAGGTEVRFSELFAPGKDTLVVYHMMFPRWSKDPRAGAPAGATDLLPLVEQPCPSCTSVVDGLNGPAPHLSDRVNLVVVAKTDPARLRSYAQERGWRNLRLLSTRNDTFNRDYHGETPDGEQLLVLNVFSRDEDGIHHRWASERTFVRGDNSPLLDLTPKDAEKQLTTPRCNTSRKPPWIGRSRYLLDCIPWQVTSAVGSPSASRPRNRFAVANAMTFRDNHKAPLTNRWSLTVVSATLGDCCRPA